MSTSGRMTQMPYVRCTGCELRFYAAIAHATSERCPGCDLAVVPRDTRTPLRDALLAAATRPATSSPAARATTQAPATHPSARRGQATPPPRAA
jgi:hypothetical protein